MTKLPEDAGQREQFDRNVALYGGPMRAMAAALSTWSQTFPRNGALAKSCAIYANTAAKAADELGEPKKRKVTMTVKFQVILKGQSGFFIYGLTAADFREVVQFYAIPGCTSLQNTDPIEKWIQIFMRRPSNVFGINALQKESHVHFTIIAKHVSLWQVNEVA